MLCGSDAACGQAADVLGAPAVEAGASVLCTGPVGCGKSALVAVLSGSKALEIPACQPRDRTAVLRSVEEVRHRSVSCFTCLRASLFAPSTIFHV